MKNTRTRYAILASLLLYLPLQAQAGGYYLGLGLRQSQIELNESNIINEFSDISSTSSFADSATSFSFFAGLPLDRYLGPESRFCFLSRHSGHQCRLKS